MNKRYEHCLKRILLVVSVFLIIHFIGLMIPGLFQRADIKVYTLFFNLRQFFQGELDVSPHLLLFTLDDAFEKKYPTPGEERAKIAEALQNARITGAGTILLDIIFRQRDNTLAEDRELAQSTRLSDNIFFPFLLNLSTRHEDDLPVFLSEKILWPIKVNRQGRPFKVDIGITPFPELCKAAQGLGGITLFPGSDGIILRVPLVYSFNKEFIPSLVLAGICHYYHAAPDAISIVFGKHILLQKATLPGGSVKDILIPVDNKGQLIVNYTGPWRKSITSFSLENLLSSMNGTESIKPLFPDSPPACLVLIGDITTASKDICPGVFEENYPLIGIIHNSLNTIITEKYLYEPGIMEQVLYSLLFLFILSLTGFLRKDSIRPGWLFILFSIYLVSAFILFIANGRLPDISLHFSAFILSVILVFYQELQEIKKMMYKDDIFKVPDGSNKNNPHMPVVSPENAGDQDTLLTNRLKLLGFNATQIEIAVLLIKGLQYKEIGNRLGISVIAAGRRINRMYQRLSVNNKIEFRNKIYENTEK